MPDYKKETAVALEAVFLASTIAANMQGKLENLDVVNKADLSPVTITDFSIQALINRHLLSAFPEIPIMGEEDSLFLRDPENALVKKRVIQQIEAFFPKISEAEILDAIDKGGSAGGASGRFWVLDPIDGTRGFIRNEQYAIALALIEEGKVVLGLLGCPRLKINSAKKGGIFVATLGKGCQFYPYDKGPAFPIHVNTVSKAHEIIYCESKLASKTHSHSRAYQIAKKMGAHPKPFRLDSQCKYALVACGQASIYLRIPVTKEQQEKIWDHAPGMLIVEEAGGLVTDLYGAELDFSLGKNLTHNYGTVVTNGLLHEKVIEITRQQNEGFC